MFLVITKLKCFSSQYAFDVHFIKSFIFYPNNIGIATPTIHASPTTSPFHSPTQQDIDGGIESNTVSSDSTPSIGNTTPPGGYHSQSAYNSSPPSVSSTRHESESSCGAGYFVGYNNGVGICSN